MEICYHVSSLLPYEDYDTQRLARKRHIGNDVVVVIFNEGDRPFDPSAMATHFTHVFIVVTPIGTDNDKPNHNRAC